MQKYINKKKAILILAVLALYVVIITPLLIINLQKKQELRGRAATSTSTPILFYPFSEGTGTVTDDSSGNGNTGTLINGPVWTTGKVGSALSFDGVDDYVNAGNGASLDITNAITLEAWVYPSSYAEPGFNGIVSRQWYSEEQYGLMITGNNFGEDAYKLTYRAYNGDTTETHFGPVVSLNQWHHVVVTADGTKVILYLDGIGTEFSQTQAIVSFDDDLLIGSIYTDGSRFNGTIDDVKIYNRALTDSEVLAEYQAATSTPILFYPFSEGTGTVTADSSGNGNTGTLINGPVWTTGKVGSALSFDGVDDYVDAGTNPSLDIGTGDFTWSLWAYAQTDQSNNQIMSKWEWIPGPPSNQGVEITIQTDPTGPWIQVLLGDSGSSDGIGGPLISSIPLQTWKLITVTREQGQTNLYIDGVLTATKYIDYNVNTNTALSIGSSYEPGHLFNGAIDDVKIYNRALTDSEVLAEYQAATPTPTPISCPIDPSGKIIVNFSKGIRSDVTQSEAESGPVAASIPAGNYKITLASYDDHIDKPGQTQPAESWYVKLKDASDTDVAVSNAISDLPDTQDWLVEEVNSNLNITQEIFSVLAFHAAYPNSSANSIDPICAVFETISPTPTPATTLLNLTIYQHGIGNSGDNTNPTDTSLSNKNPVHPAINGNLELFNTNNQLIGQGNGQLTYANTAGNYQGIIGISPSTFPSGNYYLKVKTPGHLKRLVPGFLTITAGQTNTVPAATLVTGDANNDNRLDILDYNLLLGCYSDLAPAISCDANKKTATDFNDDSFVNQIDYNLFLREIATQPGQ